MTGPARYDHRLDFAYTIAIAREEKGITQTQMGASVGVSQTAYNHYERGLSFPKTETAVDIIADTLGLDRDRLAKIWQRALADTSRLGVAKITRSYNIGGGSTASYRPKRRTR